MKPFPKLKEFDNNKEREMWVKLKNIIEKGFVSEEQRQEVLKLIEYKIDAYDAVTLDMDEWGSNVLSNGYFRLEIKPLFFY